MFAENGRNFSDKMEIGNETDICDFDEHEFLLPGIGPIDCDLELSLYDELGL